MTCQLTLDGSFNHVTLGTNDEIIRRRRALIFLILCLVSKGYRGQREAGWRITLQGFIKKAPQVGALFVCLVRVEIAHR